MSDTPTSDTPTLYLMKSIAYTRAAHYFQGVYCACPSCSTDHGSQKGTTKFMSSREATDCASMSDTPTYYLMKSIAHARAALGSATVHA